MTKTSSKQFLLSGLLLAYASPAFAQMPGLSERFDRLDRNRDGKITAEELPRPGLFQRLDGNGDGVIERGEISDTANVDNAMFTRKSDIAYGEHPAQRLDLYKPNGAKTTAGSGSPIMIYIHGGGWRGGDKARVGQKAEFFTGMGWLFVSANYRLIPEGKHPNNVQDVASAIAWAHEHGAEHGGDPDRVFIMGHSAGCHLVALVATNQEYLEKAGGSLDIVKGVIALDTQAYDLPKLIAETPSALYSEVFGKDRAVHRDASPMHHIAKDKGIPPFLVCYSSGMGGRPNPLRPLYANAFCDALRAAGVPAEVVDASDRNHGHINQRFGDRNDERVTGKAKAFLSEILGQENPAFSNLRFTQDFIARKDRNGKEMGGTECNYIVCHEGKLFASLSCWKHDRSAAPLLGPQVLVKPAADAEWELDICFGPDYGTSKILRSVAFTTDRHGNKFAEPVALLLADATRWRPPYDVGIWTRDDASRKWMRTIIAPEQPSNSVYTKGFSTEVRMIVDHVDNVSGVHYVFACTNQGKIHGGAYDPSVPGCIAWEKIPELDDRLRRTSSGGEANGDLYVSIGMDASDPNNGGLFRRIDGDEPVWKRVVGWAHHEAHQERKLTSELRFSPIPHPDEKPADILLATQAHPVNRISRIYPDDGFRMAVDLDVQDYVSEHIPGARVMSIAANGFAPFRHPDTGEQVHLGGLWLYFRNQTDTQDSNAAWYLVRYEDGTYGHGRIFDPNNPIPNRGIPGGLRDARTICASPFPEDHGRVLYFGGFNCGTHYIKEKLVNTAWIYKATLPVVRCPSARWPD